MALAPPRPEGAVLTELGRLTRLDDLGWSLRDAPVLAYDRAKRLFIVYAGKVTRPSSRAEVREYVRTHWGQRGRGVVRNGGIAVGPFVSRGKSRVIQYTTKKGLDREIVDYEHTWGEGKAGRFVPPTVLEHVCRGCGPRCAAGGALALAGGTYTVGLLGIRG